MGEPATASEAAEPLTGQDLLRAVRAIGAQTAVIECVGSNDETASLWLRDGRLVDVQLGWRTGERALLRLLTWPEGLFQVRIETHAREQVLTLDAANAVSDAIERARRWQEAVSALGGLEAILKVSFDTLATRLADVPDEANAILRLVDGQRCLRVLIDASLVDEIATLDIILQLARDGVLHRAETTALSVAELAAPRPVQVRSVLSGDDESLCQTPLLEAIPLPPGDSPEMSWAHEITDRHAEVTERFTIIPVVRYPHDHGARQRRLESEEEALRAQLALHKDRPILLTHEVLAPGTVIPPGLTEEHVTAMAAEAQALADAVTPGPKSQDDAFEQYFMHRQQRARIIAFAVAGLAVVAIAIAIGFEHRPRPRLPAVEPLIAISPLTITPSSPSLVNVAAASPAPVAPAAALKAGPNPAAAPPAPPTPAPPSLAYPPPPPPPTPARVVTQTYEELLAAGMKASAAGRVSAAVDLLEKAVAMQRAPLALGELGIAYYRADRPAQAIERLKEASALDGKRADVYMYLGTALQDTGHIAEARKAYEKFLSLEPAGTKRHAEIAAVVQNMERK